MNQTMNVSRFEEIIEKIKNHIRYYDLALIDNKYYLGLANGDNINLSFPKNNIAHLLGVYTDKLKNTNIVKNNTPSYDIIKKLTNYELTYIGMKNMNNNFDIGSLFSEYIDNKLEIFSDILKVRTDDIYCVIKYCSDRSYTTSEEKENSDYFIIRRHEKKFSVLGIVKNDERTNYVPVTARLFNNDELKEFLNTVAKNQEITYPVSFRVENYVREYHKTWFAKLEDKQVFNKTLKDVANNFKAIPSTNKDFMLTIDKFLNNRQKDNNNSSILSLIKDGIASNSIIAKEEIIQVLDGEDIPCELEELIDTCNDFIYFNNKNDENVNKSYSTIQNENANLKEELESLKKELLDLKEKNTNLENEKNNLTEENEKNKHIVKVLFDAYNSVQ